VQVSRTPLPAPLPRTRTDGVGEAPRHEVAGLGRAIKYGRGIDLLIHHVCIAPAALMPNIMLQHVISLHTSPREAGQVFSLAKPKLAAYTHLLFIATDRVPPATVDDVVAGTRETYSGPLLVGADLMSFDIGDTITMRQRNP
jgi:ribonuclease Z